MTLDGFLTTPSRRTPVYCKPLLIEPGSPPRELNRLDSKNWTPHSRSDRTRAGPNRSSMLGKRVDALILLDQVDLPETGVVTTRVKDAASTRSVQSRPGRAGRQPRAASLDFPPMGFKMNAAELARMAGTPVVGIDAVKQHAAELAAAHRPARLRHAGRGRNRGRAARCRPRARAGPPRPWRDRHRRRRRLRDRQPGGCPGRRRKPREAMELAMAAASIVIHQLGTTGTASISQVGQALA